MQKIPIDDTRFILFDDATNTSRVVVVAEAQEALQRAKDVLANLPNDPTDEELLVWARANYPQMNYAKERAELERVISENTELLK